mmetsp:Transcript_101520/g.158502  ORF Transcript_101520/g.158502 Transcript_101520/m.158502 type:complete len:582 (+) Transcript_101520:38-1783(+)
MVIDFDNIFKYCSAKYVYIRDWRLGALKYTLMLAIFVYVIIYQIIYKCSHLHPHPAAGFGNIQMFQPQHACDQFDTSCLSMFDTVDTLPYCKQYNGSEAERKLKGSAKDSEEDGKDGIGDSLVKPKTCRYFDSMRLQWEPGVVSEIFVPTRVRRISQERNPNCYDPETSAAKSEHALECVQPWKTTTESDFYVADIGEFEIEILHSFSSPALGIAGTSLDYQGYFAACKTNQPMTGEEIKANCKRFKIPSASESEVAPEDDEDLSDPKDSGVTLKGPKGNVDSKGVDALSDKITLEDLLKLTPVAQKHGMTEFILDKRLPDSFGHPGESLRDKGGMLVLDVNYDNTAKLRPGFPFSSYGAIKPITYTYRPHFVPMSENSKFELIENGHHPESRTVDVWYGITVKMQFNGKLVKFGYSKLLTALTTGLLLVTMATTIVTALASYVLPLREKYSLLMYQFSEDFGDYREYRNAAGDSSDSMYWVGKKLREKLPNNGELTDDELIGILCTTEMRLARLDGMDPKMVFYNGTEVDTRNYCIGDNAVAFYKDKVKDKESLKALSYQCQEGRRTKLPGDFQADGKLD